MPPVDARPLHDAVRAQADALSTPSPSFQFKLGWATRYDGLFTGSYDQTTDAEALVHVALSQGRALLHSEGGTGKTNLVRRLYQNAAAEEIAVVLVDLRDWTPPLFEEWRTYVGNDVQRLAILLDHLAQPRVSEAQLAALEPGTPRLMIVDGLNETPVAIGDEILIAFDAFAARNPAAGVIVTDRLARRALPSDRWELATIAHVAPPPGIALPAGGDSTLLRIAFFLNLAIRDELIVTSGAGSLRMYLQKHADLDSTQLRAAAIGALSVYYRARSRTFALGDFQEVAGEVPTRHLRETGALLANADGHAHFAHHLFHDYLAGLALAHDEHLWTPDGFDAVTFDASSFDALALALEEIGQCEQADALVRRIYDWNYYGSAYAVAKGLSLGSITVSAHMVTALLAMLAERRWDLIIPTVQRVEDALRIFPGDISGPYLATRRLEDLLTLVADTSHGDPAFEHWRRLFLTSPRLPATHELVSALTSPESLPGWTAANVLKRSTVDDHQQSRIRDFLSGQHPRPVRWRAAHVLGALPSEENQRALLRALDHDEYAWVRYGAIRSLVEMAATSALLRRSVFAALLERADAIGREPEVQREFERALQLRDPPNDWARWAGLVIERLWERAETLEAEDHWRRFALHLRGIARDPVDA